MQADYLYPHQTKLEVFSQKKLTTLKKEATNFLYLTRYKKSKLAEI